MLLGICFGVNVLDLVFVYGVSMTEGLGGKATLSAGVFGAGAMMIDCEQCCVVRDVKDDFDMESVYL